jgi:uncharacterized membrane protein
MGIIKLHKMGKDIGTVSYTDKRDSIKQIELITDRFKKGKINNEDYIKLIHENLQKLTTKRNYIGYLMNIGQLDN